MARLARRGGPSRVTGTWNAIVLLADFSDHTPTTYPGAAGPAHFMSMLFDNPAYTDSVQDYYRQVSPFSLGLGSQSPIANPH